MTEEDRVRLRHTDRFVGALVLLAIGLFVTALFQRTVVSEWLAGGSELVVMLPEEGLGGLQEGSEAEVLGFRAGAVRRIVVEPQGRVRAELLIEDQSRVFIRTDSVATIRRRFGVAGPAYLDIARGQGAPLDWGRRPVIEAKVEAAATATAGALLEDLRSRILPVLDDLQRGMRSFAEASERLNRGEGTVGRLLMDESLAETAGQAVDRLASILGTAEQAVREVQTVTAALSGTQATGADGAAARNGNGDPSLPTLLARADRTLASLEQASRDLARASPALPRAARNVAQGTDPLPGVVVQTQETARQLELLAQQLRGHWLLGGGGGGTGTGEGGGAPSGARRPSAERVRP